MSEEKKSEVTEEVKEARKLSMEELENVNGGDNEPCIIGRGGHWEHSGPVPEGRG